VDAYPLAALQAGMLFHSEFAAGVATYHDVFTLRLRIRYDRAALDAAAAEVVDRHPVLRTSFHVAEFDDPVQIVRQSATLPVVEADLTGMATDAAQRRLDAFVDGEKRRPFDLAAPPLLRVFVHHLPGGLHAFTLSFHHAILDGWSVAALTTELLRRYVAHVDGRSLPARPLPVTFRDFVARERELVAAEESIRFWRASAADGPVSRLPRLPGFADGAVEDVDVVLARLDADLVAALERIAAAAEVPLRTVLLAVHLRVLGLLCGESDVATGVVTHGRPESEAGEQVLGLFLNTVPVRVRVDRRSWTALVRAVFDAEVAVLPHRQFPLFEIQRVTGRSPVFEVLFDYRDFHVYGDLPGGGSIEVVDRDFFEQTNLPFAAAFSRSRAGGGLALLLPYDRNQFPAGQVERIRELYLRALTALAADPEADPRPAEQFLTEDVPAIEGWNDTASDLGRPAALPGLVAEQAGRTPGAPAVWCGGGWLDYAGFAGRVSRLARVLRGRGVRVGDVVGVCLPRGLDLLVAVHAVVAAGAAYLPLEPDYPDARLGFMVADAGARLVLTNAEQAGRLSGVDIVALDALAAEIDRQDPGPLSSDLPLVPVDSLAYVIYTSGSTGTPKGVGVSHRAIVNRLRWMQDAFPLTGSDRVLHKTPFSFDVSVWELFWPLLAGAGLVVADPGAHRDAARLADLIGEQRVSTVHFVPSMLEAFLDQPELAGRLAGLRRVFCSGEALSAGLAGRFHGALPGVGLHNLYGPTEAAVDVTWHPCRPGEQVTPIGRPVANTRIEILDRHAGRVPVGSPGELCIGGVQLARGYLRRPGLTAAQFVPDPYGPGGARLYRTGDLARWLPRGEVEFLGRADHQVKIRGFRVELGEIEAALGGQPEIRTAVVLARDDGAGPRLVAYLIPDPDQPGAPDPAELRSRLAATLPEHLIPAAFVPLDELPLTPNGKLDRAALPAPDFAGAAAVFEPPAGAAEETVAQIWSQVLGVDPVGALDSFFALGGDSIRSLKVISRLRAAGYRLEVQDIFQHPTVRELANVLTAAVAEEPEPAPIEAFGLLSSDDLALLGQRSGRGQG
jgi:amino acid adenylation domain-containing protein